MRIHKYSIKTNILAVFIFIVFTISIAILYSQYYFTKQLAIENTKKSFHKIATTSLVSIEESLNRIERIIYSLHKDPYALKDISLKYKHPAMTNFIETMSIKN